MRVLISNDDGIDAAGLARLERAARRLSDDVWIVAPDGNRSANGHRISLHEPFSITELGRQRFSCTGTPADCVIAAMTAVLTADLRPDLVLAGINHGRNVAQDIAYSGTIAVAREATFWGIPAISLSQPVVADEAGDASAEWLAGVLASLAAQRGQWAADGHWLNVNLPKRVPAEVHAATIGFDKIARATRTVRQDGATRVLQIEQGRELAASGSDENSRMANGWASVTRLNWRGASPLPAGLLDRGDPRQR